MLSALPAISRRHVLVGGGLFALLAVATSACRSAPPPPAVDELEAQQDLARRDSELATAAGAAFVGSAYPAGTTGLAAALAEVAAERADHARVLATEIARLSGKPESATAAPHESETATSGAPIAPAPRVSDVVDALRTSAGSAAKLAAESAGYRAGLLASIAAACTAAHTVTLVTP